MDTPRTVDRIRQDLIRAARVRSLGYDRDDYGMVMDAGAKIDRLLDEYIEAEFIAGQGVS